MLQNLQIKLYSENFPVQIQMVQEIIGMFI